ncbi:GntR family transcriptional regulator [bacterium]|nr:GntR family transcriptional regulator [bacterium]
MAGRKTLFEPVAEKLIAQIREGRIAPGEKMPSEYELCTHYALSRSSIRKALDCLEQKGLIRRQPGIGTFVCGNEPVMKKPVVIAMPELPPFSYAFSVTAAIQKVVSEQNSRLVTINPKQLNENDRFPFDAFAFIDVGGLSKERLQELARRGFPCIAINRIWKEVSCFSIDFYEDARRAVRLLRKFGMKRIGAVNGSYFSSYGNAERLRGFRDEITENGGIPQIAQPTFNPLTAIDEITAFIRENNPDALFLPLIGVLDWTLFACKQAGRIPGRDILLFCFDRLDEEIYAATGLIYADMPLEKAGADAADYLIRKVRNPELPPKHQVYNSNFVIFNTLLKEV